MLCVRMYAPMCTDVQYVPVVASVQIVCTVYVCACVHSHTLNSLCKTSALAWFFLACCRPRLLPHPRVYSLLTCMAMECMYVCNECSRALHICPKGDKSILVKSLADFPFFKLTFTCSLLCGLYHGSANLCVHTTFCLCCRHLLFLSAQHIVSEKSKGLLDYFPLSYLILQLVSRAPLEAVSSPLQVSWQTLWCITL